MRHKPALFQYLWDGVMIGVCLLDQDGIILEMNVPGSRLLGWGAVCPANVSFEEVFRDTDLGEEDEGNRQLLLERFKEEKIVCRPRVRLCYRQRAGYWVELKGVAVEDGGTTQFLVMFRDLSSETQLAEDYRRLASIPEESPFPIIEVDAAGHLLYANPAMVCLMEDAHIGEDGFTTALPDQFPELAARCFHQGHTRCPHIENGGDDVNVTHDGRDAHEVNGKHQERQAVTHLQYQRRVHGPTTRRATAVHKHRAEQDSKRERHDPEAPVIEPRQCHIRRADHHRDHPVGQANKCWHYQAKDHDYGV